MRRFVLGALAGVQAYTSYCYAAENTDNQIFLHAKGRNLSKRFQSFPVTNVHKNAYGHTTVTFGLGEGERYQAHGVQTVQIADAKAPNIMRLYSPVSEHGTLEKFEILIREYPNGIFSPRLCAAKVGEYFSVRQMPKAWQYERKERVKELHIIAGGTGICPMLQVIRDVLNDKSDPTVIKVLYANRHRDDILLYDELQQMAAKDSRLKMNFILSQPPQHWNGLSGQIDADVITQAFGKPANIMDVYCLLCGSDRMMITLAGNTESMLMKWRGDNTQPCAPVAKNISQVGGELGKLGYQLNNVHRF